MSMAMTLEHIEFHFKKILTRLKDYYFKWDLSTGGQELLNYFKKSISQRAIFVVPVQTGSTA